MLRTEILRKNKLCYPNLLHAEDYAMWLDLATYTKFEILPDTLLIYRVHGANISEKHRIFQKEQTSIIRKTQIESLSIEVNQADFNVYEFFIDHAVLHQADSFSRLICFMQTIFEANRKVKMVDADLLFTFYQKKITDYVEQNCWQMNAQLNSYLNSIFCVDKKQKVKLKFKQKLKLKKIWN